MSRGLGLLSESTLLPQPARPITLAHGGHASMDGLAAATAAAVAARARQRVESAGAAPDVKRRRWEPAAAAARVGGGAAATAPASRRTSDADVDALLLEHSRRGLAEKARIYAVISGQSAPADALAAARTFDLRAGSALPPALRQLVRSAAEEAAALLGEDVEARSGGEGGAGGGHDDVDVEAEAARAARVAASDSAPLVDFSAKRRERSALAPGAVDSIPPPPPPPVMGALARFWGPSGVELTAAERAPAPPSPVGPSRAYNAGYAAAIKRAAQAT